MNIEYYILKKIVSAKEVNNRLSRPIIRISIFAIAISVAIMIISLGIVKGFKKEITDKVIGFGAHIKITALSDNNSYESSPISRSQNFYSYTLESNEIKHIEVYATKAGIIKANEEIYGVVLKGVDTDFDWTFFQKHLITGDIINFNTEVSNHVIISENIANYLKLGLSDKFIMYFIDNPTRLRKFEIVGIYNTELDDFDNLYILGDIKQIQELNNWGQDSVGGFALTINHFSEIEEETQKIYESIPYDLDATSIKEDNPQIFDWLELQNMNVNVIIILMLVVALINIITVLVILILDRTRLIGILKALGQTNWSVRKLFLYNVIYLITYGLFWGNILGFTLALIQMKTNFISLDPSIYYMSSVPINLIFVDILILNVCVILTCFITLIIPTYIITKIKPIKAIRFQ